MGERDHRRARGEQEEQDQATDALDRSLDAALAKYAAIEPRAGLEERILANLRAERTRVADRAWWRWGWAAAATTVVVVVVTLAWRSGKPSQPVGTSHPRVAVPSPMAPEKQVANHGRGAAHPQARGQIRRVPHASQPQTIAVSAPKLDQFPSPQPLSEQEKILASYVAQYPQQAALIAKARMEVLRRDREEELREAGADGSGDSKPQ